MSSQLAMRSPRVLPGGLCTDHAHYVKNHASTVCEFFFSLGGGGGVTFLGRANLHTPTGHFKTISYAKFGGQTECIMRNSKIVNEIFKYKVSVSSIFKEKKNLEGRE